MVSCLGSYVECGMQHNCRDKPKIKFLIFGDNQVSVENSGEKLCYAVVSGVSGQDVLFIAW
jgi:hypothetical protein